MNWITITPTEIELELDGTTAIALLQSLLDKLEQSPQTGIISEFKGAGEIFRLDGNLYNQAEYKLSLIQASPPIPLNLGDIV
jgi:hypothetical protein